MFERGSLVNFALLLQVDQPLVREAAAKGCCVRPTLPFYKILFTHLDIVQIKSLWTIYFHDVANFFWGTCFRPSHTSPPSSYRVFVWYATDLLSCPVLLSTFQRCDLVRGGNWICADVNRKLIRTLKSAERPTSCLFTIHANHHFPLFWIHLIIYISW